MTMQEIDALRLAADEAVKARRYAMCYRADPRLIVEVKAAVWATEEAVVAALQQWWAQGCQEITVRVDGEGGGT